MPPTSPSKARPRRTAESGIHRAAGRAAPAPVAAPVAAPEPASLAAAVKTTRVTLDLSPGRYEALKGFADSHRVKQADVLRELIALLEDDAELAARVTSGIAARKARKAAAVRATED